MAIIASNVQNISVSYLSGCFIWWPFITICTEAWALRFEGSAGHEIQRRIQNFPERGAINYYLAKFSCVDPPLRWPRCTRTNAHSYLEDTVWDVRSCTLAILPYMVMLKDFCGIFMGFLLKIYCAHSDSCGLEQVQKGLIHSEPHLRPSLHHQVKATPLFSIRTELLASLRNSERWSQKAQCNLNLDSWKLILWGKWLHLFHQSVIFILWFEWPFSLNIRTCNYDVCFIENNRVTSDWGCNPSSNDSIVFNENSITCVIAELMLTLGVNGN